MEDRIVWCEIPVVDFDRAVKFYSGIFGYTLKELEHEGVKFAMFDHGENNIVSGCVISSKEYKPSQEGALVYLNVNNRLDAAIEAVRAGGGKIVLDKQQIGPWGYRAVILDTEGNKIALHSQVA